jgi:starch-binding outer membrane protein, SusD/RagB family
VFEHVLKDLAEAKADLPDDYVNSGGNRYGVNKSVIAALQARVYLHTGNYAAAESNASEVIAKTDLYQLIPSDEMANGVFARNNTEAIFQFMGWLQSENLYTSEGNNFVPADFSASATYSVTENLYNAFDADDLRRDLWITDVTTLNGITYHVPYKYKNNYYSTVVETGEYPTVLRLAEQYLIRAEARARLATDVDGARADLNAIRTRAGLEETDTADPTALVNEVIGERRKELFLEFGLRWLDLKRTGLADEVLGELKPTWKPAAALFPIPQNAIDANPNLLPNNPGY